MSGLSLSNQTVSKNGLLALFAVSLGRDWFMEMDGHTELKSVLMSWKGCCANLVVLTQLWVWTRSSPYEAPAEWNSAKGDIDVTETAYPAASFGLI